MAPGMATTLYDDESCGETVLRFLETPSPDDYSFDFGPTRVITEESEGQDFEENLVVDEYLFMPYCIPRQIIQNKVDTQERPAEVKTDEKTVDPGMLSEFTELTEAEMIQSLRLWKQLPLPHATNLHPATIKEADVYGASTHYFYSVTKYSGLKRPTRLRVTGNGCRWKQQGGRYPIRVKGQTVAYKTYLSYVPLKSAAADIDGSTSNVDISGMTRDSSRSLWTMEEIALAEDIQSERLVLRRKGRPRPFPVLCRVDFKTRRRSPGYLNKIGE